MLIFVLVDAAQLPDVPMITKLFDQYGLAFGWKLGYFVLLHSQCEIPLALHKLKTLGT